MLNKIIKYSLNNKYIILLSSLVLIILGTRTAINMDVDVFPDFTSPTVNVFGTTPDITAPAVNNFYFNSGTASPTSPITIILNLNSSLNIKHSIN